MAVLKPRAIAFLFLLLGGLLALAPMAAAAPQVLPYSSSALRVSNADEIWVICNSLRGIDYRVISPEGSIINFFSPACGGGADSQPPSACQFTSNLEEMGHFRLSDGQEVAGPNSDFIVTTTPATNFDTDRPADGTWHFAGGQNLGVLGVCATIGTKLVSVVGSTLTTGYGGINCFYNWRSAANIEQFQDVINSRCPHSGEPAEDPNNFVFFSPQEQQIDENSETSPATTGANPQSTWTLNGFVSASSGGGRDFTASQFVYIPTASCGASCDLDLRTEAGQIVVTFGNPALGLNSHTVSTLTSNTPYSFQFIGQYTSGEDLGQVLQFTTTPTASTTVPQDDQIGTTPATSITATTATLNGAWSAGTINGDELTMHWFAYVQGTPAGDTDLRENPGAVQTTHLAIASTFNQAISGLTPFTTYSFQAFGERPTVWTKPGNVLVFTTQASPPNPDPDPQAFTTQSSITCPTTAIINGVWIRGATQTGNTFGAFYHRQGLPIPLDNDLRDDLGTTSTGYVDKGSGAQGTHSATIAYNNVVGNSYQLVVKAGTGGTEQLGAIVYVSPGQCDVAEPTSPTNRDADAFTMEVSHAQCNGDLVEFMVVRDGNQATNDMDVTILDGLTNLAVLTIDDSEMWPSTPPNLFWHFNRSFSAGPYLALAIIDISSVLTPDLYDAVPFNVPGSSCFTTTDLNSIINNIDNITQECVGCVFEGNFLQGTELGETSVENILLLLIFFLICWFIWAKSVQWAVKLFMPLMVVILFLATLTFIDKWTPIVFMAVLFMAGGAYMTYRGFSDFAEHQRQQKTRKDNDLGLNN